jgi:hypothetical protein
VVISGQIDRLDLRAQIASILSKYDIGANVMLMSATAFLETHFQDANCLSQTLKFTIQ